VQYPVSGQATWRNLKRNYGGSGITVTVHLNALREQSSAGLSALSP
jgi:hypothetical protein